MKGALVFILSICIVSCSFVQKKEEHLSDWDLFSQLEINKDTQEIVKKKMGKPDEIVKEYMGPREVQWNYNRKNIPKIRVLFVDGLLQFAAMSVWEREDAEVLSLLLDKFPGKWEVEQEKPLSAHFMPSMCYLTDKTLGKKIEINGNKKIVESVSKENPGLDKILDIKIEKQKTYLDVDPNRCDWLKDFLKTKGILSMEKHEK